LNETRKNVDVLDLVLVLLVLVLLVLVLLVLVLQVLVLDQCVALTTREKVFLKEIVKFFTRQAF
jgi:hypothetical protein